MTLLSDRTISYWLPSIFDSVGGVQSFGRRFVKELEDLTPDARHQIVLKNDRVVPAETGFKLDTRYSCWGNVSETFRTPLFSLSLFLCDSCSQTTCDLWTCALPAPCFVTQALLFYSLLGYLLRSRSVEYFSQGSARGVEECGQSHLH